MSKYLFLTYLIFNSCQIEKNSTFTKLQDNIYEINNQYFYGEKVHTYLIELNDMVLLFDIPAYSNEVKEFILSFDKTPVAIISHGSCGIDDGTKWQREINLKVYAHAKDKSHPWIRMEPDVFFTEMPKFDKTIEVIHVPGHSEGSICVLETLSKSIFTGDTFYGNGNGQIKDFTMESQSDYENLEDRIESCKNLLNFDFENVYPFHYDIILKEGKVQLKEFLKNK